MRKIERDRGKARKTNNSNKKIKKVKEEKL